ncbi:MAG: Rne/Rng family ribonuclease [Myxococcota bacterium]
MRNEIFVNVALRETRVAVHEADKIVELHIERANERGVVGGIYKGRVTRVLPGMQAAFVDIGLERAAFLYVGDYRADLDDALDDEGNGDAGNGGRGRNAAQPQIEDVLEEGREIVVQVSKEPLGSKGARITSRISLPGRHLVLMPAVSRVGVSRRIAGDRERRRLRSIVDKLRPEGLGFIVRTVSHGVSEADIKADIDYLAKLWQGIQKRLEEIVEVPSLIHREPPLHLRVLRDLATRETKQIIVDDADAYGEMQDFVHHFMATPRPRIAYYDKEKPLFDAQHIETAIEEGLGRKVFLKSGGHLVIDQSEALTAIDVNTGRYTGGKGKNLEDTILKTNLEAVREIVHQLRLRNIGGLIILDLIDMDVLANREKVYRALSDALREDKSKVNLLKISELGLVEMTRKRTRESLPQQLCEPCPTCEGKGYLQSAQTLSNKIFRELPKAARYLRGSSLRVAAHPEVTDILEGEAMSSLALVQERMGRTVIVEPREDFHRERYEIGSVPGSPRVGLRPPAPEPAPPDATPTQLLPAVRAETSVVEMAEAAEPQAQIDEEAAPAEAATRQNPA